MSQKINIDQTAELARLNLKSVEREKLAQDLESILACVDQLKERNTESVAPTSHVLPLENVFRKDEVRKTNIRDAVLNHAPKRESNFFKVPKIIEGV